MLAHRYIQVSPETTSAITVFLVTFCNFGLCGESHGYRQQCLENKAHRISTASNHLMKKNGLF